MNTTIAKLLEKLTPEEQAEIATFAMFILARRKLRKLEIATDEVSTEELMQLVENAGSFDWLGSPEEDAYSLEDGVEVLADPELMKALRQSIQEVAEEQLITWEDAKSELGL